MVKECKESEEERMREGKDRIDREGGIYERKIEEKE